MPRIAIRGFAAVFGDGRQVTDPATLGGLVPLSYDDSLLSDYLPDADLDPALVDAIAPSGTLRFDYDGESTALRASVEYQARRPLTEAELQALAGYTLEQWSDGIAENGVDVTRDGVEYAIRCITYGDGLPEEYPWVDVNDD